MATFHPFPRNLSAKRRYFRRKIHSGEIKAACKLDVRFYRTEEFYIRRRKNTLYRRCTKIYVYDR